MGTPAVAPSSEKKPPPTSSSASSSSASSSASVSASSTSASLANQEMHRLFGEKLRRSLMLDDVTPQATVPMIRTALGQFGNVTSVDIITDPLDSKLSARKVLVEMASAREASHAVKEIQEHPFMLKGVPRPVRAVPASSTMFPDRPRKIATSSNGSIKLFKWVKKGDPDWDRYNEQKQLAKRHASEVQYLMQEIRKEEEKLAQEQEEKVKENLKKLDEIQACTSEKTIQRLSRYYGLKCESAD